MGLWSKFFKPNKRFTIELKKSAADLKMHIEKDLLALYRHKEDDAFKRLERVFSSALTVQLLETNAGVGPENKPQYDYVRGRLDALRDVAEYFQMAKNQDVHEGLQKKYRAQLDSESEKILGAKPERSTRHG